MNRSILSLSVVLLLGTGCGAQLSQSPYSASVTDGDRYASALDEAFERYEGEVATAERLSYATESEAVAVSQTLSPQRFEVHLASTLHERGLTRRGLRVYASHHAEFASAQQSRFDGRLVELEGRASRLVGRVDASLVQAAPELAADPTQVAQR